MDPELRDPENGDFRAMAAPGYGSRVLASAPSTTEIAARPGPDVPAADARAPLRAGNLTVAGDLAVDTLWDATLVLVTGDVTIRDGAVLTVAPGVAVRFTGYHGLLVRDGALQVQGTAAAPVVWDAVRAEDWTATPDTSGSWNGITFLNVPAARASSYLRGCVIRHAKAVPGFGLDDGAPRVGGVAVDGDGGALRFVGPGRVEVSGCVLRDNAAVRGGALAARYGAAPLVVNSLLRDNVAWSRAGAAWVGEAYPRFVHTTIVANRAVNPNVYLRTAGAIDHFHARPRYLGCIVYGNTTLHHDACQILEPRAAHVDHCDVEGYGLGAGGLDADPRFAPGGDWPVLPGADSPCRDAGDFALAAPWLTDVDLTGRPRLSGARIDLGCCEYQPFVSAAPSPTGPAPGVTAAPNPANPGTTVRWRTEADGSARVTVHDVAGRRVRVLFDGSLAAGSHAAPWDGRDQAGRRVAAGAYVVRVESAGGAGAVTVVLLP